KGVARLIAAVWVGCLASPAAQAQTNGSATVVQLPIELRQGDLLVRPVLNGSEPLLFKVDTGFGITTIHPGLVDTLNLTRAGRLKINGIAGDEQAATYSGAAFDFNGARFAPRRVAALPSDARRRWQRRAGILGA